MNNQLQHHGILGMKWGVRRFQNPDGSLTAKGKKRDQKEVTKEINKRNTNLFINANNKAADRINNGWLEGFNKKWEDAFNGYDRWSDSPKYTDYENEYIKNLNSFMHEAVKNDPTSVIKTKLGSEYTARYLEDRGDIQWATDKEWKQHDNKKNK